MEVDKDWDFICKQLDRYRYLLSELLKRNLGLNFD